ncbi:MAG: hypothetical protein EOO06_05310 [Chitinophagaceae bacterium]|nr:MAG: hypothetical protein EOO06_05310 [Chitinophagaceae bacterium]
MRQVLVLVCIAFSLKIFGQGPSANPGTLPSIIPPSPDVAALAKVGSMSTSLHTGTATASIPLYELSVGQLKIPIALNYSTNGTRTNDIPSRVGLGWNLVAGGSISRVIHDEEDDGTQTIKLAPPDFSNQNQALLNWLFYANQEHYDTEADEYSFSVNGMSGQFFFDASGAIRVAEHSNIKIARSLNSFTLTSGDGTVYEFGKNGALEKTRDVKTNGTTRTHKVKTTAWFLTKITSQQGDIINFNYTPIYIKTALGPNQSVILKTTDVGYPGAPSGSDCPSLCQGQWSSVQQSKVDYDTHYLSSITSSNGQQVYFVYANRPDLSGDNRLSALTVYSSNNEPIAKPIKQFEFQYDDYTVGTDLNQRFFLRKVYSISTGNALPQDVLVHELVYNDPSTLGSQQSLLQDYYGYSQGSGTQPQNFFPRPANYQNYENGSLGTDRSPNFEATKAGTLSKIIYPTGGYEEFLYEPHSILSYNNYSSIDTSWSGNEYMSGAGAGFNTINTYTRTITTTAAPAKVYYTTEWNAAGGPAPGTSGYWTPDGIHFLSYLEIWDVGTNTRVFNTAHRNYEGTEHFFNLEPNTQYEIRLKVAGNSHFSYINVKYNPVISSSSSSSPVTIAACGLRVKQINSYDPVSKNQHTKYYTYAVMENMSVTSGVGQLSPAFAATYQGGGLCQVYLWSQSCQCNEPTGQFVYECPGGLLQLSSSALSGAFTFNGSPVAYRYVIESDDPALVNGGTQHEFFTYHNPQQPLVIIGQQIAGASSAGPFPDENGTELQTTLFKRQGSNNVILKTIKNEFSSDPSVSHILTNYIARKRWDPPGASSMPFSDKLKGYDCGGYIYMSVWRYLSKTVTTEYDQDGLNPLTSEVTYTYNNPNHLQPTAVTTQNSKGQQVVQQFKYPHDFTDATATGMVTKNMVALPLETKSLVNGATVSTVENHYQAWQAGSFYKPSVVKAGKGAATPENRLLYYQYDEKGNPLELSKDAGQHISYLWNYQKTYPVAEVKNASFADIAYTSFEGDDAGNWTIGPEGISDQAITGSKGYSGTLTKQLNSSQNYIITLWTKSTASVNGTTGTLLTVKNGWSLYKWTIANAALATVNGLLIDEVRLYPVGAQMNTYTHLPFIGISSVCDVNNKISYYQYDGLNRLVLVRDIDKNIIKQFQYKYNQMIAPCPNSIPNWQPTGRKQCLLGSVNNNYTGEQTAEERDQNNCSATYLQTRWVSLGITGECAPIPNCTGNNKRVVNGVCETGTRINISSNRSGNTWTCFYKYVWSDGFESRNYIETSSTNCMAPILVFD